MGEVTPQGDPGQPPPEHDWLWILMKVLLYIGGGVFLLALILFGFIFVTCGGVR